MSRAIKFRVWDTKRSCYITAVSESDDGHGLTLDGAFSYCSQSQFGYCPDSARYVVEQFIGLLDSEGQEIYEGDIVENGNNRGPVVFKHGSFYISEVVMLRPGEPRYMGSVYWHRVAGNIHQHPDLLKTT